MQTAKQIIAPRLHRREVGWHGIVVAIGVHGGTRLVAIVVLAVCTNVPEVLSGSDMSRERLQACLFAVCASHYKAAIGRPAPSSKVMRVFPPKAVLDRATVCCRPYRSVELIISHSGRANPLIVAKRQQTLSVCTTDVTINKGQFPSAFTIKTKYRTLLKQEERRPAHRKSLNAGAKLACPTRQPWSYSMLCHSLTRAAPQALCLLEKAHFFCLFLSDEQRAMQQFPSLSDSRGDCGRARRGTTGS